MRFLSRKARRELYICATEKNAQQIKKSMRLTHAIIRSKAVYSETVNFIFLSSNSWIPKCKEGRIYTRYKCMYPLDRRNRQTLQRSTRDINRVKFSFSFKKN